MESKRPPNTRIRQTLCPSLPPEVWITIFSHHTDLAHLWLTCRRVSSTLRACVDYAFAECFLCDVAIDFQLEKYNLGGKGKRPEVPVLFDRLGKRDEKHMAWFSDKRPKNAVCDGTSKQAREQYVKVMQRWEDNVKSRRPEMPNYTISIRGIVNDTALPGLAIDIEAREIRFEWRNMLDLFYREHERQNTLKHAWHSRTAQRILTNNSRLASGDKLMPADYPQPWSTAEPAIRKQVRRARLKESYADDELMCWAIESLKHFEDYGAAGGNANAHKVDPDLPGAGVGERWFGCLNRVQEMYLDEWSCLQRIDGKIEVVRPG